MEGVNPKVLELIQTSIRHCEGLTLEEIIDAYMFCLCEIFVSSEVEEKDAGMSLFKVFARIVNTDMKRNIERMVVERKARNAAVQDSTSKPE